ncbi:ABC transporter substrate-binding protein [Pseudonocardia acaciae]|uniref:ABC transporter substrate-binding protein n=1 Tax=Pseudonocardia acaciae TaxID=551276 RepID=UPI000683F4D5|nr:ABC transporter substrate-binding protein [Pseudonocardia acaciae]
MVTNAKRRAAGTALALVAALLLAACGSGGSGGDTGPIRLGGLFTLSPQPFGNDAQKMIQTVFDEVNARGGINGRTIEYLSGDDTGSPTEAARLARDYVDKDVVAMVGSTSFVDCGTNHGYYQQQELLSVVAIGADPFCFTSPNITPVNIGPFTSITADLYYASKFLNDKKICIFLAATPGSKQAQLEAVKQWTAITGQQPALMDDSLPLTEANFTPYLLRAKDAGCDALFRNGADTVGLSVLKAAQNQGMQNVDFLFDASSYSAELAQASSPLGMKVYLASEFEPYTAQSSANAGWRAAAERGKVKQTAFTQGAYVAADWIIAVLKSIQGPITRESVTKALRAGTPYSIPMVGSPLVFGPGKSHAPNQAIKMVKVKDGSWETLNSDFFTLPKAAG